MSLARAQSGNFRTLCHKTPNSWEFCGFSQNGEDGIIDFLCQQLLQSNRYFVEIGAADGLENNTAWLAIAKKFSGLMIEGDALLAKRARKAIASYNLGVTVLNHFVDTHNIQVLLQECLFDDPDVFSLDIDGVDYYVMEALLQTHFHPKIIAVEYNSAFGPDRAVTIPYRANFNYTQADPSGLYYGVSIAAWRKLLAKYGYQFVTVDSNGVNAFFINPRCFSPEFIAELTPKSFAENFYQRQKFKGDWTLQFARISHQKLEVIN
jgi:hypothetical protein